jgi:dihydroorotate dehydrogenase
VNISSPNTKNLRDLQGQEPLNDLLRQLMQARVQLAQRHGKHVPLLVKIAPDVSLEQIGQIAQSAREFGLDGLIATNTTLARPGLEAEPLSRESGGLSGAPLKALAESTLVRLRAAIGQDFVLVGVGGICSGDDARTRRRAGADLVQIYSGFIYRGPALISECVRAMIS